MSDNVKYSLIKIGLFSTILGGIFFAFLAILSYFMHFFVLWGSILCGILSVLLLGFSEFFKMKRNKYRDIVEYDDNGINIKYGNFSNMSNQERALIEKEKALKRELLVDSVTLKNITHKGDENPEESLNRLVGLEETKIEVKKMAARMKFEYDKLSPKERRKKNFVPVSTNHMCFIGPPGTAKTTCARIMTGFLYKYHYIKKNQYIEIDGNFFNGTSIGDSTEKAKYILGQAMGGVLFIDEAYALMNSYNGQEAIATIVKFMEDNRNNVILILAGYEKEMQALINSNSGLESRIKYWLHFKNYNSEELWSIFKLMAKDNDFEVSEEARNPFMKVMLAEIQKPNYGNARTVRNVLDKSIDQHAYNLMEGKIPEYYKNTILANDICLPSPQENSKQVQMVRQNSFIEY